MCEPCVHANLLLTNILHSPSQAAERWASSDKNPNKGKVTGVELEMPIEAIAQPHAHDESDPQMVQPIHNPMVHALHPQDPMPM